MGEVRIVSTSSAMFADRHEAGKLLADQLKQYSSKNAVVLGIPRGGVVIAAELARALKGDLDIILARKLRTPGYDELAMGSVAEDGKVFLNDEVVREFGVRQAQIKEETALQMAEIQRRTALIRRVRSKVLLKGRIVIVTDDGVATGATTQAALWAVREEQPSRLVAAMPVGPEDTIKRLGQDVDEIICLRAPPFFSAVGQFYEQFQSIEDEDVIRILGEWAKRGAVT